MCEIKQACEQQPSRHCAITSEFSVLTCNQSSREDSAVTQRVLRFCFYRRSRLLLLVQTRQICRENRGIYLFTLCCPSVLRCPDHQWVFSEWLLLDWTQPASLILEIQHTAECEVAKRISCTGVWNTYFCELQRLNWPNYGKSGKVFIEKTKIIDVSDALIIWDPGIKHWKGRLASAAHCLHL